MFQILDQNSFRVINLTDGSMLFAAKRAISDGVANGINMNFIRNFPETLDPLVGVEGLLSLNINGYDLNRPYDYSMIHSFSTLRHLSILTDDRKEIDFSCFPLLQSAAIFWRPKANTIFNCTSLTRLFLGKYTAENVMALSGLQNLEYLRLNTGSIRTLYGIRNLANLCELKLMQLTKLEDIKELDQLKKLASLQIYNCKRILNINVAKEMHLSDLEIAGTTPS